MAKGPDDFRGRLRNIFKRADQSPTEERKLEARSYPELVAKYQLFKNSAGFESGTVYHPCGATDVSPSEAFPGSRIIYADIDDKAMEALRSSGYDAHTIDVQQFNPGVVDVLVLLNPQIRPDIPASFVKEGGYVVSNNYHATADRLKKLGYIPVGVIVGRDKDLNYDTNELDKYWQEVDSDNEFKEVNEYLFADAARTVETVTGKRENIPQEYKKIIEGVREGTLAGASNFSDIQVAISFDFKGDRLMIPTSLPRKKGSVDDMFVFRNQHHE